MLKAEVVEFSEAMLLEERAYVFANPYESQLRRIFELAGVGFGRIDYSVKNGRVITWEINLLPTMGPPRHKVMPDSFAPMRQPIRDHFNQRLHAALKAVDRANSPAAIVVAYSTGCREGDLPIVRPPATPGALVRIARALPPMRPLFDRATRLVSPLVARLARRYR
jgi:hypothetical protein